MKTKGGLGTTRKRVVSFTNRPLYPRGKRLRYHSRAGWVGTWASLDVVVKREESHRCPWREINPSRLARGLLCSMNIIRWNQGEIFTGTYQVLLLQFLSYPPLLHGNSHIPGSIYCPGLGSPQTRTQNAITASLRDMQCNYGLFNIRTSGRRGYIMEVDSISFCR